MSILTIIIGAVIAIAIIAGIVVGVIIYRRKKGSTPATPAKTQGSTQGSTSSGASAKTPASASAKTPASTLAPVVNAPIDWSSDEYKHMRNTLQQIEANGVWTDDKLITESGPIPVALAKERADALNKPYRSRWYDLLMARTPPPILRVDGPLTVTTATYTNA